MPASGHNGSAGTVYQELKIDGNGNGTVLVDNNNMVIKFNAVTPAFSNTVTSLPSKLNPTENLSGTKWISRSNGLIGVSANTTIASLILSNTTLQLTGNTLTMNTLSTNSVSFRGGRFGPQYYQLSSLVDASVNGNVLTFLQLNGILQ